MIAQEFLLMLVLLTLVPVFYVFTRKSTTSPHKRRRVERENEQRKRIRRRLQAGSSSYTPATNFANLMTATEHTRLRQKFMN